MSRQPRSPNFVLSVALKLDSTHNFDTIASGFAKGEVLTGLLYLHPDPEDLHTHFSTVDTPFNTLCEKELCPGAGMLEKINAALR